MNEDTQNEEVEELNLEMKDNVYSRAINQERENIDRFSEEAEY